ncbi:MAG: hypothetical protein LLF76_05450 [Planctomycetaceae bacterium]|nr:hypothetical protein [Planctomycetaceae bacterium]
MAENSKPTAAPGMASPAKSFMTAGPTLHYSHANVLWFWFLSLGVFVGCCWFWHRILYDQPISLDLNELVRSTPSQIAQLGRFVVYPISIYEYPWHIVILGILMGLIATVPLLISQLLSFRYSIPFILSIIFIAKLQMFGLFVLVSCVAVACRPLRFRSRFISIALCMAPQLVYWAVWGGYPEVDPVRWGLSFAPWIYAWVTGLFMAGIVLGIGHFTRYKPGLVFAWSLALLLTAFGVFQKHIGFAELDYQLFVAGSSPEDAEEFHEQSIKETLDAVVGDDALRSFLVGRFYPTEPILLRQKLKEEIQSLIIYDRWPQWFQKKMPDQLKYPAKRRELIGRYDLFMERWPASKRKAAALYFKAILNDYHPDVRKIASQERLCFYWDYPFADNIFIWQELFTSYPQSLESLEARWRMAYCEAGGGNFEKAQQLCEVSLAMLHENIDKLAASRTVGESDSIFASFREPARTVMTPIKLHDLQTRFLLLQRCIAPENRGTDAASSRRLAAFILLNPYSPDYGARLDELLVEMPPQDGLRDNILLDKAMISDDMNQRLVLLSDLIRQFPQSDGGIRAMYELGLLKIQLWKNPENSKEGRDQLLEECRSILAAFSTEHAESPYAEQAKNLLQSLPNPSTDKPL